MLPWGICLSVRISLHLTTNKVKTCTSHTQLRDDAGVTLPPTHVAVLSPLSVSLRHPPASPAVKSGGFLDRLLFTFQPFIFSLQLLFSLYLQTVFLYGPQNGRPPRRARHSSQLPRRPVRNLHGLLQLPSLSNRTSPPQSPPTSSDISSEPTRMAHRRLHHPPNPPPFQPPLTSHSPPQPPLPQPPLPPLLSPLLKRNTKRSQPRISSYSSPRRIRKSSRSAP